MERLTHSSELAYPVTRSIMDETNESEVRPSSKASKTKEKPSDKQREESEKGEIAGKKKGDGNFSNFDASKFEDNKSLEELSKMVRRAGEEGEVNNSFLQDIQSQLQRRVQLGLVSDNQSREFTAQLNEHIARSNDQKGASTPDKDFETLAKELEEIIKKRKSEGITADNAESAKAVLEQSFGRELTPGEFQRAVFEMKNPEKSAQAKEFESQISIIEELASNPKRFDAFISSIEEKDPESIKQAMSGKFGKITLSIMLGDIADGREDYIEKWDLILKSNPDNLKGDLKSLARQIEQQEEAEKPQKGDPEKIKQAKEAWEKRVEEIKKQREITAEEADTIKSLSERGIPPIEGGADDEETAYHTLLENIGNISNDEEVSNEIKDAVVDHDFVTLQLQKIHGNDTSAIEEDRQRWKALREISNPIEFKSASAELLEEFYRRAQETEEEQKSDAQKQQENKKATETLASGGRISRRGMNFSGESLGLSDEEMATFFSREPENVEELATWIMASDDKKTWGKDGIYPLFRIDENGERIFQEQNFLKWFRTKSLEHHGDNANDPMTPLTSVSIETLYRPVNLISMKYNKQRYFADKNGILLSNLANEVIGEAFIFGQRRNKDLAYRQVMTSDEQLFEALVELNAKNDHTSDTNLKDYLQMGDEFDSYGAGNKDNKVGDAMLGMNQIYRNLADIERLREVLPEDAPIFTAEGFKNAVRVLEGKDFDEEVTGYGNLKIEGNKIYHVDPKTKIHTVIFDENGNLTKDDNLVSYLNVFPDPNPAGTEEHVVRELAKQSMGKIVGFDTGASKEEYEKFKEKHGEVDLATYRKLARLNLDWAEMNSWVEQRWNGAAARNDTRYRGYDAWTKMYAQYYRERQSGERTGGPIGNPEDMQIFRLMSPDMWLAIRTESGESVQEVLDRMHDINLELYKYVGRENLESEEQAKKERLEKQKEEAYNTLKFPRDTERDWASNGIKRQSEVWHNVLNTEDLAFNEIVKRDNWGVLKFDNAKFEEVVKDDFIKKRRYAFSSNNAINYGAMTRMRVKTEIGVDEEGKITEKFDYKDMPLADAMFGEAVMGPLRADWFNGRLKFTGSDENGNRVTKVAPEENEKFDPNKHGTYQEFLNSDEARMRILKNVCRSGLAAQLRAHRSYTNRFERWDSHAVRKFYQALRSMPRYVEDPETGQELQIDGEQFFSEEDIEWIKKQTGTSRARLLMEDGILTAGDVAVAAFPEALKIFFKDVIS